MNVIPEREQIITKSFELSGEKSLPSEEMTAELTMQIWEREQRKLASEYGAKYGEQY